MGTKASRDSPCYVGWLFAAPRGGFCLDCAFCRGQVGVLVVQWQSHGSAGLGCTTTSSGATVKIRTCRCACDAASSGSPTQSGVCWVGADPEARPTAAVHTSVRGSICLQDRLRDAPAVVHCVTVLPGPLADRVRLLPVRASGRLGHRRLPPGAASPTRTSAGLTTVLDEGSQGLVELVGVLVRQVDLVGTVVQREGHRPDRVRAIDVVDEPHGRLLCHCALPSMKGLTGANADCRGGAEHPQLSCQESPKGVGRSLIAAPPEPQGLTRVPARQRGASGPWKASQAAR